MNNETSIDEMIKIKKKKKRKKKTKNEIKNCITELKFKNKSVCFSHLKHIKKLFFLEKFDLEKRIFVGKHFFGWKLFLFH